MERVPATGSMGSTAHGLAQLALSLVRPAVKAMDGWRLARGDEGGYKCRDVC